MRCVLLLFLLSPLSPADALTGKVDALFEQWNKPDSPGCAVGIISDGEFVHRRGYGMANLEHSIPLSSRSIFDIGSTSKQFTALSILLLARQGKISLDDSLRKHLPEMPAYQGPITVRHLIHHTSGIRDYLTLARLAGKGQDDFYTDGDVVWMLARQKELNFKPGAEHLYSNSGYFLMSQIVQRASGQSLRAFAHENIFKPLGMESTHFYDDHTMIVKNRATGYSPRKGGGFQINMSTLDMVGDGGIYTSVEDLFIWDQNFYDHKLGGKDLIAEMMRPGTLNSGEALQYAFGLTVSPYKGLKMVSHGGSWAGFRAEMIRFPDQRFSVICLCNLSSINPSRLARQIADLYLADKFRQEATKTAAFIELPLERLQEKAGAYWNAATGSILELAVREGKLMVGESYQISPITQTQFRSLNVPATVDVTFESQGENRPLRMRVEAEGRKPETFEKVQFVSPGPAQLSQYAGDYFSEELEVTYKLLVEEGKLFFKHRNAPDAPLQPTLVDRFRVRGISIRFNRDENGKVSALSLNAGRVKNIRFTRR